MERRKNAGEELVIPYDNVPKTMEELPEKQSIYEFRHKTQHLSKDSSGNDKYQWHYPGLIESEKHPNELCMPCCMKYNKDMKISGAQVKRMKKCTKNSKNWSYSEDGFKNFLPNVPDEEETSNQNTDYIYNEVAIGLLKDGELCRLSEKLQFFFNFDSNTCDQGNNIHAIKDDTTCLLRWGIKYDEKQSFVEALVKIYNHINDKNFTLSEFKKVIVDTLTIDCLLYTSDSADE